MRYIIILVGATITLGWAMIEGWRLHCWLHRRVPALAGMIPRDTGAVLGLLVGILIVAGWTLK